MGPVDAAPVNLGPVDMGPVDGRGVGSTIEVHAATLWAGRERDIVLKVEHGPVSSEEKHALRHLPGTARPGACFR